MSYIIFKTDGTILTTIPDGTLNTTSTPLSLPGRLYPGYGQVTDTNFVHLLENFAANTPPQNALAGQLWYNTTPGDEKLYICPADGETNPNNWIAVVTANANGDAVFGNIDANNINLTNTATANLVDTDYLTVNIQANIANANVTGNAVLANVSTNNITSGSTSLRGNLIGAWTVNGYATLNGVDGTAMWVTNGNLLADGFKSDNWYYGNGTAISFDGTYSNSNVANYLAATAINATTLNGYPTSTTAAPNTISLRDANGNIAGNFVIGNGSQLTGINTPIISNGQSNVNVPSSGGNVTVSIGGSSNVAVFSSQGLSVPGSVTTGNVTSNLVTGTLTTAAQPNITSVGALSSLSVNGNITAGGNLQATFFIGDGSQLSNIQIGNASVSNANYAAYAGNVTSAAQSNITSLGTLSFLIVSGNINAGNVIGRHFGNGAGLTNLTGSSVSGPVANATYADTAGTVSSIPSGTKMLFVQTSAPTGWTKLTSADNAALRIVSGAAGSGGSTNFTAAFTSQTVTGTVGSTSVSGTVGDTAVSGSVGSTTVSGTVGATAVDGTIGSTSTGGTVGDTALTINQIPPHDHSVAQWFVDAVDDGGSAPYAIRTAFANTTTGSTGGGQAHGHSFTGSSHTHSFTSPTHSHTFSSPGHTHSFSSPNHSHGFSSPSHSHTFSGGSINLAVKYVDAIIAQKD